MKPVLYETHAHTPLCGHGEGMPADYAAAAERRGLKGVIITEHCPMPESYAHQGRLGRTQMDDYVRMVADAAEAWRGRVDVLLGLESDWLPGMEHWLEAVHSEADFHYVLGSVHCNLSDYREPFFDSDPVAFQKRYFEHLAEAAETGLFDALAHPDLVKNITPHDWEVERIMPTIEACLDRIAASGVALELNTHVDTKPVDEWLPGPQILARAHERGIPVVLGGDAHQPEKVGQHFPEALRLLRQTGFPAVSGYRHRERRDIPIRDAIESLAEHARPGAPA